MSLDRGLRAATLVVLLGVVAAGCSPKEEPIDYGPGHARVRLLAVPAAFAPGETVMLGITFDLEPGWHTYWKGQNDTGYAVQVDLELPPGFTAGETRWPAPERHVSPGDILDHVYYDRVTLLVPITAPADAPAGTPVLVGAKVNWLACKSECVPGSEEVTLELPVVDASASLPSPDPDAAARIDAARARLPRPLAEAGERIRWTWEDGALRVEAPGARRIAFYPDAESVPVAHLVASGEAEGEVLVLTPDRGLPGGGEEPVLAGVLAVFGEKTTEPVFFSLALPLPNDATKENEP